ncbi:MAG: hypothetical protein ABW360_02870 [Phenylobacterium sp.]
MARASFRNRKAWALWIFMGIWMFFLCLITYVLLRDGPPPGYSWQMMWAVMFFFWSIGLSATVWASTQRIVHVDVTDTGALDVTWRWPIRVERRRVEAADVPPAEMIYGSDSDGDPYYTCRVTLADGNTIDLAESHDESSIEATVARFNAIAGRRRGPLPPTAP